MPKVNGFTLISLLLLRKRSCKGFTLMELLVAVAIMAGLVTLVLPQLTKYATYGSLQDGMEQLQSSLRAAQNNASSSTKCSDGISASSWYLSFIYDTPSSSVKSYQIGPKCSDGTTPTPTTYNLPTGVSIKNKTSPPAHTGIEVSACHGIDLTNFGAEVFFGTITNLVTFQFDSTNSGCPAFQPQNRMVITLQLDGDPAQTREVTIEKGGAIYTN
ncbi:MAG: type II secretion system protein [bacterium]|nr:type II secretion system protein [bacterium]